jgi:hypothetical protein
VVISDTNSGINRVNSLFLDAGFLRHDEARGRMFFYIAILICWTVDFPNEKW